LLLSKFQVIFSKNSRTNVNPTRRFPVITY
jgi:hypothetical protein